MRSSITANTEINVVINGNHTFTIKNTPEDGLLYYTKSNMNKGDYIQGLYALIEAAFDLSIHKIEMDNARVMKTKFGKG